MQQTENLPKSHISRRQIPGTLYQRLTISMPYLILYEAQDPDADRSTYFEFCEYDRTIFHSTFHDFLAMGEMGLHSHDFYELTFVQSGTLRLQIENETIEYHAGDCYLCNKNVHHKEFLTENAEIVLFLMKEDYIRGVLEMNYFYDEFEHQYPLGSFFYNLFSENRKNPFYDAKQYIDFCPIERGVIDSCIQVINQIILEITGRHSGRSHMIKALLCRFIEILEDPKRTKRQIHEASLSVEEQVVLNLANVYRKKQTLLTRREVEKITGYNSDYAERLVKRQTGMTLQQYGRTFQMKKAAAMLLMTDRTIGNICEELGYSNRNYFNKIFASAYGMSPSDYRKNQKKR